MAKKKIFFVFAPTADPHDRFFNCYPGSILHAISPLVSEINRGTIPFQYIPYLFHPKNVRENTYQEFSKIIEAEKPDVVAICSTYDSWHVALKLSKLVRENQNNAVVIHGGPYLDEVLEPWVLKRMPGLNPFREESLHGGKIDFAVGGDGEYILLRLCQLLAEHSPEAVKELLLDKGLGQIPGRIMLSFELKGAVHHLRAASPLDLNSIPYIPRNLLPVSSLYDFDCFKAGQDRMKTVTMITHRGCRARCNFCSEGLPYQQRSLEHIEGELKALRALKAEAIFLDNSTIQDDPKHLEMFQMMSDYGFQIGALTRFNYLQDLNHVKEMRRRNVTYLYASVEQYDDSALEAMDKRQSSLEIERGVENLRRADIRLGISLLFGLPYETPESVSRTIDQVGRWVAEGSLEYVSMSLFAYHPRTPLGSKNDDIVGNLDFSSGPPNLRYPYTGFEEGTWYHPPHVNDEYVADILHRANDRFGNLLVRNIGAHRGSM